MTRLSNDLNTKIAYFAGLVIGGVGAVGQAFIMHNTLVHSYPFKMMGVPPFSFYRWIGEVGLYVAPTIAVVMAFLFFKSVRQFLIPVVPVLVCPLVFWLVFEIAFGLSSYERMMTERNFDGYTGETARYYFGFEAAGLALWGTILGTAVGLGISAIINLIAKFRPVQE